MGVIFLNLKRKFCFFYQWQRICWNQNYGVTKSQRIFGSMIRILSSGNKLRILPERPARDELLPINRVIVKEGHQEFVIP